MPFTPTTRTLALLSLAAAVFLAAGLSRHLLYAGAVIDGLLLIGLLLDSRLLPGMDHFRVSRSTPGKLSIGEENPVRLEIAYMGAREIFLTVIDEPPVEYEMRDLRMQARLQPRRKVSLEYRVLPFRRGRYDFGAVHLFVQSRLGLLTRRMRAPIGETVRVYPNIKNLPRYELYAYRSQLLTLGTRSSSVRGSGTNYESLRRYEPDDDFRRIHWKATARHGRPISVEYQIERSQSVVTLIDAGRLMGSRVGEMTKLDFGINASLVINYVSALAGDKAGALAFSSDIHSYVPPKQGRRQTMQIADSLYDLEPRMVESDYDRAFAFYKVRNRKRCLVILFSDILDSLSSEALMRNMLSISGKHLPLLVAIGDSHLRRTADSVPESDEDAFRKAMALKLLRERESAIQTLRRKGVWVLDVQPENLTVSVVNQYLELKTRNLL